MWVELDHSLLIKISIKLLINVERPEDTANKRLLEISE